MPFTADNVVLVSPRAVDPEFLALPLRSVADAALSRARELGATHADVRVHRLLTQGLSLRDGTVPSATDSATASNSDNCDSPSDADLRAQQRL